MLGNPMPYKAGLVVVHVLRLLDWLRQECFLLM